MLAFNLEILMFFFGGGGQLNPIAQVNAHSPPQIDKVMIKTKLFKNAVPLGYQIFVMNKIQNTLKYWCLVGVCSTDFLSNQNVLTVQIVTLRYEPKLLSSIHRQLYSQTIDFFKMHSLLYALVILAMLTK